MFELMFDINKDIQPLTTFRRQSSRFLKQLKKSKRAVVLTVNGKAAAVVQDAEAYQRLLDIAARAGTNEAIRPGLEHAAQGRIKPAQRAPSNLRRKGSTRNASQVPVRSEQAPVVKRLFESKMAQNSCDLAAHVLRRGGRLHLKQILSELRKMDWRSSGDYRRDYKTMHQNLSAHDERFRKCGKGQFELIEQVAGRNL